MSGDADRLVRDFQQQIEPLLRQSAAYAYAIVRHREDAEDAVQEAAIKGLKAFASYDVSRPFKGWWLTILRNCCRDLLRRRQSGESTVIVEPASVTPEAADRASQYDELQAAMDQLAEAHREILELRYFGGCAYREISGVLGIPEGTVMSRLHAARQALVGIYRKKGWHYEARSTGRDFGIA